MLTEKGDGCTSKEDQNTFYEWKSITKQVLPAQRI